MLAGIITDYAFGLGYMLLAGVAYLIRDWRKLQLAISAPGFLLIFYIWVVPHSARWLLANDRREEAIALLRKAALVNGRVLPPATQVEKCEIIGGRTQSYSAVDLVRTPQMRKRALILFYIWFVNVLVYYGLSLGVSRLGTDLYLNQFVFGLVEIPARTLVLLVLPRSRRLSQTGFLAIGGLACLLMLTVPLVIFGISPLLGAVLALALPETANRPLPDTVEDVENWDMMRSLPAKDNPEKCESVSQSASSTEELELQHLASQI